MSDAKPCERCHLALGMHMQWCWEEQKLSAIRAEHEAELDVERAKVETLVKALLELSEDLIVACADAERVPVASERYVLDLARKYANRVTFECDQASRDAKRDAK